MKGMSPKYMTYVYMSMKVSVCLFFLASTVYADCTASQLKGLLLADADSIGLFIPAMSRNDNQVVAVANQIREEPLYRHTLGVISRDKFLGDWLDVMMLLPAIPDPVIRAKWLFLLQEILHFKDTIDYSSPAVTGPQGFTQQLVADGIQGANGPLTVEEIQGRITRPGSWAELRCGKQLTLDEVSTALNLP